MKTGEHHRMTALIEELWTLKRDILSDDFDRALYRLIEEARSAAENSRRAVVRIHEYPTGEPCWTWRVPEKWTCHEAYLETLDGRRLIDYADHPLHVVSYSLPFEGLVSRQELLDHLHAHPQIPDAIPFVFKIDAIENWQTQPALASGIITSPFPGIALTQQPSRCPAKCRVPLSLYKS